MKIKFLRLILCLLLFVVVLGSLLEVKLYNSNDNFILSLLNNSNHYNKNISNLNIKSLSNLFFSSNINNPITLLDDSFNIKTTDNKNYDYDKLSYITSYIENKNNNVSINPIIYIYNSHQLENYSINNYESYNIAFNVLTASYMLKENLKKLGIESLVENNDINKFIKKNNWDYSSSYKASRHYINEVLSKNKTINYLIDLHRDSINRNFTTLKNDNNNYAKVMFVIGEENKNYEKNLALAYKVNNKLTNILPGISRGVIRKKGVGVNGVYNQDVSENAILIELGGYQNDIIEVNNTIEILASVLKEIINEKK